MPGVIFSNSDAKNPASSSSAGVRILTVRTTVQEDNLSTFFISPIFNDAEDILRVVYEGVVLIPEVNYTISGKNLVLKNWAAQAGKTLYFEIWKKNVGVDGEAITPASIGAANETHASAHATGGTDAITPASIGAASEAHAGAHATGRSDAITPASIGASADTHNHDSAYTPASHSLLTIDTEAGAHDIRWYEGNLEFYNGSAWVEIQTGGGGGTNLFEYNLVGGM